MIKSEILLINFLDFFISLTLIVLLFPLIIFIYLLILTLEGTPVVFISSRVGKQNIKFNLYKFRTMKIKNKLTEKDKITKIGKYLRRLSFDELPQLFNVLKGEMSMVGPRPVPSKNKEFNKFLNFNRYVVKPGLTGLSQINYYGKKRSWKEKLKHDEIFIKNYSLSLYLLILLKTPKTLLLRFIHNKSAKTL